MSADKAAQSSREAAEKSGFGEKKENAPGDRWYDLTKFVVGFVLTGLVGTWLTHVYKEKETSNELQRKESETVVALFSDLAGSFSDRHYYALRADLAVEAWNDKGEDSWRYGEGMKRMEEAYRKYDQSVTDWNLKRFRLEAILQTHFGKEYRDELETKIIPIFGTTEDELYELHEFAIYNNYYAQYLQDSALKRIEHQEEDAIQSFFDHLSKRLKEHEKPSN